MSHEDNENASDENVDLFQCDCEICIERANKFHKEFPNS